MTSDLFRYPLPPFCGLYSSMIDLLCHVLIYNCAEIGRSNLHMLVGMLFFILGIHVVR